MQPPAAARHPGAPAERTAVVAVACAAALVLGASWLLQAREAFPAGGDPGHMVSQGRASWDELRYPPLVPAFAAWVFAAGGGDFAASAALLKAFAVVSCAFAAAGLARLAWALSGGSREVAAVAFLLGVAQPMALYQLLWGGLAQFWGAGLAAFALSGFMRWDRGWKERALAAAGAVGTFYAHWYTAAFLVAAAAVLLAWQGGWKARWRGYVLWGGAAALACLPLVPVYANLAALARPADEARALWSVAYFPGFGSLIAKRWVLASAVAAFLALCAWSGVRHRLPGGASRRSWQAWAAAFLAGFVLLLAATPESVAGRAYYFIPLLALPLAAAVAWDHVRHRRTGLAVATAALVAGMGLLGLAASHDDLAFFTPMDEGSLAAFERVGPPGGHASWPDGGVLVLSPFPNVDGWWLEAVTGRAAVPTDAARFYAFGDEVAAMQQGRIAAAGTWAAAANGMAVATSPASREVLPVSILAQRGGDAVPLLDVHEAGSAIVFADGHREALGRAGEAQGDTRRGWSESWVTADGGVVRRQVALAGAEGEAAASRTTPGATLTWTLPPGAVALELAVTAGTNATWGLGSKVSHLWAPAGVATTYTVAPWTPVPGTVGPHAARLAVPVVARTATLAVHVPEAAAWADGIADQGGLPQRASDRLDALGVAFVYLRAVPDQVEARFAADPAFAQVFRDGDVRVFVRRPA